jgi:hypothetical protein
MSFVVVISKSSFGLTCHITILVDCYLSKARFTFEELITFCEDLGIHWSTIREDYPHVEIFIDIQELQASTTSLILDFRFINFILVVRALWTLQMQHHCIHVAFEGGVKGIIIKGIIVIV